MNTDFYAECLVSKAPSGADTAKKLLIGAGAFLIAAAAFWFIIFPLSFLLIFGAFYGAYYLMTNLDTEYEYIITNGDLDIDKILAKSRRKRLVTVAISDFTAFGKLSEAPDFSGSVTVLASDGTGGNDYFADFNHKTEGAVRLIFTPNEKILDGMEMFLPRQLRAQFRRDRGNSNIKLDKSSEE